MFQAKKWALLSKKKWSTKQKHGFSEAQKEELAPEVVRKIIKVGTSLLQFTSEVIEVFDLCTVCIGVCTMLSGEYSFYEKICQIHRCISFVSWMRYTLQPCMLMYPNYNHEVL